VTHLLAAGRVDKSSCSPAAALPSFFRNGVSVESPYSSPHFCLPMSTRLKYHPPESLPGFDRRPSSIEGRRRDPKALGSNLEARADPVSLGGARRP